MADFQVKGKGFSALNKALGAKTPSFTYAWSGDGLILKDGCFDENAYLNSKYQILLKRPTELSREMLRQTFARVIEQNRQLLFEMRSCNQERFELYDSKFNLLIEAAFTHEENELNLRQSKENIKNSLQLHEGWMSLSDVNRLMRLTSSNPADAPDPRKFIPKHRR